MVMLFPGKRVSVFSLLIYTYRMVNANQNILLGFQHEKVISELKSNHSYTYFSMFLLLLNTFSKFKASNEPSSLKPHPQHERL